MIGIYCDHSFCHFVCLRVVPHISEHKGVYTHMHTQRANLEFLPPAPSASASLSSGMTGVNHHGRIVIELFLFHLK